LKLEFIATEGGKEGRVRAIGEFLHAFQDLSSHQKNESSAEARVPFDDRVLGIPLGHGCLGHSPDQTWKRPPSLTMEMAEATFGFLLKFRQKLGGSGVKGRENLSSEQLYAISDFIRRPNDADMYMQAFGGGVVWFENVRDYTEKIRRLNPNFSPAAYEARYRDESYKNAKSTELRLQRWATAPAKP
jgi:hypothetical protein